MDGWTFFFLMFLLFWGERERDREQAQVEERQRERETQNPKQAPGSRLRADSTEPNTGLELMNCEIVT